MDGSIALNHSDFTKAKTNLQSDVDQFELSVGDFPETSCQSAVLDNYKTYFMDICDVMQQYKTHLSTDIDFLDEVYRKFLLLELQIKNTYAFGSSFGRSPFSYKPPFAAAANNPFAPSGQGAPLGPPNPFAPAGSRNPFSPAVPGK